ncbi:immunity 49 family protein [Streptomyces sp. NPDC048272]|uniref:immunity 49 family protein n=1 Tax=Streptomyces sp. NPDC048272 TaxID=3154616 RepID=UPI003436D418
MQVVTPHEVSREAMTGALDDIRRRTRRRWHSMRHDDPSPAALRGMRDELLDHVAARGVEDPVLDESSRSALRTAAECALGELSVGCFPNGDQEITFPLIGERLTSEDISFEECVEEAPTARTWLDTFAVCVAGGLVWDWQRVIGLLLRDFARAIHDGVPYSRHDAVSDPGDLAAMDALRGYLTRSPGHLPRDWPTVALCKPDAEERGAAARALDAIGSLTPDQRLLRVLLDDDREAFEQALVVRLVKYRESAGVDAEPRTLLPLDALALAVLAVQVHAWEPAVRSGYLPPDVLGRADALRRAADGDRNDLGRWTA